MIGKAIALTLLVGWASAAMPPPSNAQRLYSKDRDELAQEAQKLAEDLETGALFDKQIKNLTALSRQDIAIHFLGARRKLRAAIDRFTTWGDVKTVVDRVDSGLRLPASVSAAEAEAARKELNGKIAAARAALETLKNAVVKTDDPALSGILGHVGDLTSLLEYADKLAEKLPDDKLSASLTSESKHIASALDKLTELYTLYTTKLEEISKLSAQLEALKVPLQTVALQALQVDEAHWKAVGAINARREAEQASIKDLVEDYRARAKRLNLDPAEEITVTVGRLSENKNREDLADVFLALHTAAALAARGSAPAKLAEIRLAQEEHRYSIRKSAVLSRAYEVTIGTGTKRLALYHKGGIKPELIAQFVQAIAALAIPPAILAR